MGLRPVVSKTLPWTDLDRKRRSPTGSTTHCAARATCGSTWRVGERKRFLVGTGLRYRSTVEPPSTRTSIPVMNEAASDSIRTFQRSPVGRLENENQPEMAKMIEMSALGRMGRPEEVAQVAAFLVSSDGGEADGRRAFTDDWLEGLHDSLEPTQVHLVNETSCRHRRSPRSRQTSGATPRSSSGCASRRTPSCPPDSRDGSAGGGGCSAIRCRAQA